MTRSSDIQEEIVEAAENEIPSSADVPDPEPDLATDPETFRLKYENDSLKQKLIESQDTHDLRKKYVSRIFWLTVAWLVCVLAAVIISGFGHFFCLPFKLSDSVLIAFITSTTVNVIGLFIVAIGWLFPKNNTARRNRR